MGKSGTEPDRDRSVLRIDERRKGTGIKKNVRAVSEIVLMRRTNQEEVKGRGREPARRDNRQGNSFTGI